jgi:hypothetical protein
MVSSEPKASSGPPARLKRVRKTENYEEHEKLEYGGWREGDYNIITGIQNSVTKDYSGRESL